MRRITIHLEQEQYEPLNRMAQEQKCSLSALIKDMLQTQIKEYHQRDLERAAQELLEDYTSDPELTAFTLLNGY